MKIKILYSYLFHIQKQINILKKYINLDILNYLPEDFFKLISGIKEEVTIKGKNDFLVDTIIFLIYFKIINGSNITFELQKNILKINNTDVFNNYIDNVKDLILKEDLEKINFPDIPIVILTYNRYKQLKECIEEYKNNLKLFNHNKVEIFVSDDSDIDYFLIENKKLENIFNIKVIDPREKTLFIQKKFNKFKNDYIYYVFGGHNVKPSYGKNRNFVSLYFYDKSFISLDDDSLPYTLTIKPKTIYNYIVNLDYISESNLNSIQVDNKETFLLPVDFYTYYKFFGKELMFSKYCGTKDMETYYLLLKQMNFDLKELGVTNEERLKPDYFLYDKKINVGAGIHTLCTYFPKDFKNKITISSNYRIEDLIIGANYYIEKNIMPLEVAFSIFHNREKIENIDKTSIENQIFTKEIYPKYLELLNLLGQNDFFNKFSLYINNNFINIDKNKILDTKGYINYLHKIYSNALRNCQNSIDKGNLISILNVFSELSLISEDDLKNKMENFTNIIFKELARNFIIYKYIEYF
ncbi:MAG: hypothetical protein KatS3mg068_0071 [Candidatus Sericytochromatia bacterium]|nr:MAG: hypothetical protein KatS3mg068_0071 [Candidatus Sericytochromatia bacterium]